MLITKHHAWSEFSWYPCSGSPFTGSLSNKRKHELVEIAEALNISDPEAKMTDLKDKIQTYLNTNETSLSTSTQFKGLYHKKRRWVLHFPSSLYIFPVDHIVSVLLKDHPSEMPRVLLVTLWRKVDDLSIAS
jgi:hypothetical protein